VKGEFLLVHKLRHYRLAPPIYWALMSNGLQICISASHDFLTTLLFFMEVGPPGLTRGGERRRADVLGLSGSRLAVLCILPSAPLIAG
jgi:hypothetical protein